MKFPVNKPLLQGNELKYLKDCIDSGWISSEGEYVKKFEKHLAEKFNRKYAVAVTNGTVALDIAVDTLGLSKGDEILIPSFTIISCMMGILRNGLKPVFIDSNISDFNMDPNEVSKHISSKTKAIMIVHIYGMPVNMNPIIEIANKFNLKIIEDAAEVIGQTYYGKPCGSFGDISTMSFYANKHITTGEGGAVFTDNDDYYEKICSYRNLFFNTERRFKHYDLGYNARMTNLQAALGLAQLENLKKSINKKREIGNEYQKNLKNVNGITLPPENFEYADNIYWVFGILLTDKTCDFIDEIKEKLRLEGIGTRPFFWPLHLQPVLKKYNINIDKDICHNSTYISKRGFYLPSGIGLEIKEIKEICTIFKNILKDYN